MIHYEVVFIGIPRDLEIMLFQHRHQKVLVIEDRTMFQHHQNIDFQHPLVRTLYDISQDLETDASKTFEEHFAFFEQVVFGYEERARASYVEKKAWLAEKGVDFKSGKVQIKDNKRLELSWLDRKEELSFDEAYLTTKAYRSLDRSNPFVYTFGDLVHFQYLPKSIAVEMDSLEALEIAYLWARYGSKVSVLITKNALQEVQSLYFRDGIRDRLAEFGIEFYPRTSKIELTDKVQHLELDFISMNQPTSLTVEAYFVAGTPVDLLPYYGQYETLNLLKTDESEFFELHLNPPFVQIGSPNLTEDLIVQKDLIDLSYFQSTFAFEGGMELTYNKNTHRFNAGTFYCKDARSIAEAFQLIKQQKLSLIDLAQAPNTFSIFSIFKEFALDILNKLEGVV